MSEELRGAMNTVGDTLSLSVLVGYFFAYLPAIATIMTIIWTGIRIYETKTVQRWLGRSNEPIS